MAPVYQVSTEIYRQRLEAIRQIIDELKVTPALLSGQMETVHGLADGLTKFGTRHFGFFAKGYSSISDDDFKNECSLEHILQTILDQMACDVEVLQRARDQRTPCLGSLIPNRLSLADRVALCALRPAQIWLGGQTTVLTYMQKSWGVRVVPYAKVALIGLPLTCVSVKRDFLAIPHEIGHYLYWHGTFSKNSEEHIWEQLTAGLRKVVGTEPCFAWREEIFADVYGCLVAGLVAARSSQDQQLEYSRTAFMVDDGKHPKPGLRPYIYLWALERLGKKTQWPEAYQALTDRWNQAWTERTDYQPGKPEKEFTSLRNMVESIVEFFRNADIPVDNCWPADLAKDSNDSEDLYTVFEGKLATWPTYDIPALAAVSDDPWLDWVKRRKFFEGADPPVDLSEVSVEILEKLELADGWVTKRQHKPISPDK